MANFTDSTNASNSALWRPTASGGPCIMKTQVTGLLAGRTMAPRMRRGAVLFGFCLAEVYVVYRLAVRLQLANVFFYLRGQSLLEADLFPPAVHVGSQAADIAWKAADRDEDLARHP